MAVSEPRDRSQTSMNFPSAFLPSCGRGRVGPGSVGVLQSTRSHCASQHWKGRERRTGYATGSAQSQERLNNKEQKAGLAMCRCLHSTRSMFLSVADLGQQNAFDSKAWLWHQRPWRAASQIAVGGRPGRPAQPRWQWVFVIDDQRNSGKACVILQCEWPRVRSNDKKIRPWHRSLQPSPTVSET